MHLSSFVAEPGLSGNRTRYGCSRQGNQVSFGPAIAAFARGAFPDGAGIKAGIDVSPMDPEEHARYYETGPEREIIPSAEVDTAFLAVLERVFG